MSTPFDVRRWAEQAGIHTTGGFSVVAECVTLDELQRFADIAIATAAKHWQRAHAITALAMEERQEMSTPFKPEWLQPGAVIPVDIPTLAAFAEELRRVNQENQALRQALETKQEPVAWISDSPTKGNGKRLHWTKSEAWRWSNVIWPLYSAPLKRKWVGLTDQEINSVCYKRDWTAAWTNTTFARAIEQALKEKNHGH